MTQARPAPVRQPSPFNSFEIPVMAKIGRYLDSPNNGPLLVNNEDDLAIIDDARFFDQVSQGGVPADALERLRTGELTRDELARKMQISRAIVRREKSDMFVDRVMTATFASDTCQSLYRVATGGEFVPVLKDDTVETVTHRVGDYVTDLMVAGRETRIVRNAAADRLTRTIRDKFDTSEDAARKLTVLAGKNSMKKVIHYADQLASVTKGFEKGRVTAGTREKLMRYIISRPREFQEQPDLIQLIADRSRH